MTKKELLRQIHRDNREINRNLQHLTNIGLIGLLGKCGESAKKNNDTVGRLLAKTGLILVALSEIVLLFREIIDFRKEKTEKKRD